MQFVVLEGICFSDMSEVLLPYPFRDWNLAICHSYCCVSNTLCIVSSLLLKYMCCSLVQHLHRTASMLAPLSARPLSAPPLSGALSEPPLSLKPYKGSSDISGRKRVELAQNFCWHASGAHDGPCAKSSMWWLMARPSTFRMCTIVSTLAFAFVQALRKIIFCSFDQGDELPSLAQSEWFHRTLFQNRV